MAPALSSQADWTTRWSSQQLDANRHALYLARLQRLRETMRHANLPVLLVMDANNIFYATGARNRRVWSTASQSRSRVSAASRRRA